MAGDPGTTLLVVLGASRFPEATITSSPAFRNASNEVADYFTAAEGFRLQFENLVYLFDSPFGPDSLNRAMTREINERQQVLQARGLSIEDIIVYYVGHGLFDERKRYCLALITTRNDNLGVSSLDVDHLMVSLDKTCRHARKFIIIDACYSGEGALHAQSQVDDQVRQHIRQQPTRGAAFLTSSSRNDISEFLPDHSNTVFTRALLAALWRGSASKESRLSLRDLHALIEDELSLSDDPAPHPELHCPVMPEGDIAQIKIFPNGPGRLAEIADEAERTERRAKRMAYFEGKREAQRQEAVQDKHAQKKLREEMGQTLLTEMASERRERSSRRQHFNSEEEKLFVEEAETVVGSEKTGLLRDWLLWKAEEHRIEADSCSSTAEKERRQAEEARTTWNMFYENAGRLSANGAHSASQMETREGLNYLAEANETTTRAERSEDEAVDLQFLASFAWALAGQEEELEALARSARSASEPFAQTFDRAAAAALARRQRRRRLHRRLGRAVRLVRIWTLVILALLLVGTCMYLGDKGA